MTGYWMIKYWSSRRRRKFQLYIQYTHSVSKYRLSNIFSMKNWKSLSVTQLPFVQNSLQVKTIIFSFSGSFNLLMGKLFSCRTISRVTSLCPFYNREDFLSTTEYQHDRATQEVVLMEVINSDLFFLNLCRFHKYKYHSKLEWLDLYRSAVKTILNKKLA